MTPEVRKMITERYTSWAEVWGISLAFAVTQSLEKAERLIPDAVVALIASETERELREGKGSKPIPPSPAQFAAVLWELASREAFRGFGADAFFRMPAIARAIVVLKTRAQFSRQQIAAILKCDVKQVDDHLENARLLFSDGRSWLAPNATSIQVEGDTWKNECPQWTSESLQEMFAHYVGNDLDVESGRKLHAHLVVCTSCRKNFAHFKQQYTDWVCSVPVIDPNDEMRKHLTKVTRMALKIKRKGPPSPLPGLRKIMRDSQIRIMLMGGAILLGLKYLLDHWHHR